MSVPAFIKQSNAVIAHDVEAQLGRIVAPTQITCGIRDRVTSLRFADQMANNIRDSELVVFDDCAHAIIYENVAEFNGKTLEFLKRQSQSMTAAI
jgi:pimeloyl-ACP methyl ester carboxylesterase